MSNKDNENPKEVRVSFDIRDAIDAFLWPFFVFIVVVLGVCCLVAAFNWLRDTFGF